VHRRADGGADPDAVLVLAHDGGIELPVRTAAPLAEGDPDVAHAGSLEATAGPAGSPGDDALVVAVSLLDRRDERPDLPRGARTVRPFDRA